MNATQLATMTQEELIALVLAQQTAPKAITCKVSEKGAISIYGLGQWPVTLYKGQFDRLDAEWDKVRAFRQANDALLSEKPKKA